MIPNSILETAMSVLASTTVTCSASRMYSASVRYRINETVAPKAPCPA